MAGSQDNRAELLEELEGFPQDFRCQGSSGTWREEDKEETDGFVSWGAISSEWQASVYDVGNPCQFIKGVTKKWGRPPESSIL